MTTKRHSEAVLSDLRDHWWHSDYLELVAKRLDLGSYQRVADIGSGQGHWGHRLLPLLAPDAQLCGVDMEESWVEHAQRRAIALGLGERTQYKVGNAAELPFDDNSFDLVTCQTLIMHVPSPQVALSEMLRILKPGGRILLSEPSNLPNQFSSDTVQRAMSPKEVSQIANLFVSCSRGRANLGRGDDSVADVLPELMSAVGLSDIEIFQNDRCAAMQPPYSEAEQGQLAEELGHSKSGFWLWNKEDAKALYEAGQGESAQFELCYQTFLRQGKVFEEQVQSATYARTGGGFHYLLSGVVLA